MWNILKKWIRNSWVYIVLIILFLIALYSIQNNRIDYNEQIDSLQIKIDSLENIEPIINERIDTVTLLLNNNEKQYEENLNIIINNNMDSNYQFFQNYLIKHKSRLDSICNSKGTNVY